MKGVPLTFAVFCAVSASVLVVEATEQDKFSEMSDSSFVSSESVSSETYEKKSNNESDVDDSDDDRTVLADSWTSCPKDMYLRAGRCRPCSQCGPDLYVRNACTIKRDTVCDWCLNPSPFKTKDFRLKCSDVIELQNEFNNLLEQRTVPGVPVMDYLQEETTQISSDQVIKLNKNKINTRAKAVKAYIINHLASFSSVTYKVELLLKFCVYLVLIALLFVVIRFISRSKPYYRTVTVNPPIFDDNDKTNIIRAADEIRDKLGKKGYERLEEFI